MKKKMKRMQMGGKVMNPALAAAVSGASPRGTGTNDGGPAPSAMGNLGAVKTPTRGPAMPYGGMSGPVKTGMPVRGGGGVPLQGPGDMMVRPERPELKGIRGMFNRMKDRPMSGAMKNRMGRPAVMKGGGLARKGVGMALARGGLVKANGCATRGKTKGKIV